MSKIKEVDYGHLNWGPFVLRTIMPGYITKKLITEGKKLTRSYNKHLAGQLNNQFLYPNDVQQWFYNEIHPIIQAYRDGHCKYHNLEKLNVEFQADDLWVNFMKAGDFNPLHTHGGDYSFVYFLDIPKALEKERKQFKGTSAKPGALMFEYTQQQRPKWSCTGHVIYPEVGDFYMFPAMLAHWVCPFKSKVTRVSVSGNLRVLNKKELTKYHENYF